VCAGKKRERTVHREALCTTVPTPTQKEKKRTAETARDEKRTGGRRGEGR